MLLPFEQLIYYYYFVIHIPITIFLDSCTIIPEKFQVAKALINWHITRNHDFLLVEKPYWFQFFILIELVFQLPLFIWFITKFRQLWAIDRTSKRNQVLYGRISSQMRYWLRIYGFVASTTTFVCLIVIAFHGYYYPVKLEITVMEKIKLIAIYAPYFVIPFRLLFL